MLLDFDLEAAARFFGARLPLSLWEISARWEDWGSRHGFPRNVDEETVFFEGFWNALADEFSLDAAIRHELHQFDYTSYLAPYPDVLPALQALHAANLRIGVLSNFALASLERSLEVTGLAGWIDVACAATVIGVSKPARAAYAITAQRLGVAPEHCLFFDDEWECVMGAAASGMRAYHVDRRLSRHDLAAAKVADLSALALLIASPCA